MKKWAMVLAVVVIVGWSLPAEAADFNGDGTNDIGIFRSSSGLWAVRGVTRAYFGRIDDWPMPGDYDGDGTIDVTIFRPSSGLWAIRALTRMYFGGPGDEPLIGVSAFSGCGAGFWSQTDGDISFISGNVGIGTDSPSQMLDVVGAIQLGDTSTPEAGVIRFTGTEFQGYNGSAWSSFGTSGGGASLWSPGGGNNIYYNQGKVGIGTASPNRLLHIKSESGSDNAEIDIQSGDKGHWAIYQDETTEALRFWNADAGHAWTIETGGNVGIGTMDPDARFQVTNLDGGEGVVKLQSSAGDAAYMQWNTDQYFQLDTYRDGDGRRLPLAIQPWGGNVGIGTTTPQGKLDVAGGITLGANFAGMYSPPTNGMIIEGDVGIGTASPDSGQKLHVEGEDAGLLLRSYSGPSPIIFDTTRLPQQWLLGVGWTGKFYLTNNTLGGQLAITVERDNNFVGIGNYSPSQKLDVDGAIRLGNTSTANPGTIRFTGLEFQGYDGLGWSSFATSTGIASLWSQSGSDIYFDTGNAGIGTDSPSQKLDVAGAIKLGDNTEVPSAGVIRWNGSEFQGYNGLGWSSFATSTNPASVWSKSGIHIYYNEGYVAIGTSAVGQQAPLHITDNEAPAIVFEASNQGDKMWAVGGYGSGLAFCEYPAGPRMYIEAGGNVGIGTTSPDRKLTVQDSGNAFMNLKGQSGTCELLLEASDSNGGIISTMTDHKLEFRTNNETRMTISTDGKVWIGADIPDYSLDIWGTGDVFRVYESTGANTAVTIGEYGETKWKYGSSEYAKIAKGHDLNAGYLQLISGSSDHQVKIQAYGDSYFTGGPVGIGTANPSPYSALTVAGSVWVKGSQISIEDPDGGAHGFWHVGSDRMELAANNRDLYLRSRYGGSTIIQPWDGKVGIGTDDPDPQAKLEVDGGPIKATGGLIIETRNDNPGPGELVTGRMWLIE